LHRIKCLGHKQRQSRRDIPSSFGVTIETENPRLLNYFAAVGKHSAGEGKVLTFKLNVLLKTG
jgi:hypothetical protein